MTPTKCSSGRLASACQHCCTPPLCMWQSLRVSQASSKRRRAILVLVPRAGGIPGASTAHGHCVFCRRLGPKSADMHHAYSSHHKTKAVQVLPLRVRCRDRVVRRRSGAAHELRAAPCAPCAVLHHLAQLAAACNGATARVRDKQAAGREHGQRSSVECGVLRRSKTHRQLDVSNIARPMAVVGM